MKTLRIDHAGINVEDLEAAKKFFIAIGFEVMDEMDIEGEWVGRIIGLTDVRDKIAMMRIPGSETMIELIQFHHPKDEQGIQQSFANTLGLRHLCLAVDDVEAGVAAATKHGGELMGEIYSYENFYKLCYLRGPEGIIIEMAEKLK